MKERKLTLDDIIQYYLINGGSECCTDNPHRATMFSEMNEIKEHYADLIEGRSSKYSMKDIIRMCVRGLYSSWHQRRVKEAAIDEAVENIMGQKFIINLTHNAKLVNGRYFYKRFLDFEELYEAVKQLIGGVNGIGLVTIYDTARRIGHLLSNPIYPYAYVYLHYNCVNKSAESVLKKKHLRYREPAQIFIAEFGTLPSIYIEDILCTYSDVFINVVKQGSDADGTIYKHTNKNWRSKTLRDFLNEQKEKQKKYTFPKRWKEFELFLHL